MKRLYKVLFYMVMVLLNTYHFLVNADKGNFHLTVGMWSLALASFHQMALHLRFFLARVHRSLPPLTYFIGANLVFISFSFIASNLICCYLMVGYLYFIVQWTYGACIMAVLGAVGSWSLVFAWNTRPTVAKWPYKKRKPSHPTILDHGI